MNSVWTLFAALIIIAGAKGRFLNLTLDISSAGESPHFLEAVDAINKSVNYINAHLDFLPESYSLALGHAVSSAVEVFYKQSL